MAEVAKKAGVARPGPPLTRARPSRLNAVVALRVWALAGGHNLSVGAASMSAS